MTKLPQSNIFSASTDEIRALFSDYLDGNPSCTVLAVSERPLDANARLALDRSCESFGYGDGACTYATLFPANPDSEGGDIALDPDALFMLVESGDPLCVICADRASIDLLGRAYRTSFNPDSAARAFGRPAVMFADFASLLSTDQGKQRAWKLLKSLPKR